MTQITFDPNEPVMGSRFSSEQIRQNWQSLSRANDLRCTEQDPPDLTVLVEPGRYAILAQQTLQFVGGNSPTLDTASGGSVDQQRIAALELDSSQQLHWNYGAWVSSPTTPTAPAYTGQRIALCEVLVTYNMTEITQSEITDVRPVINLGADSSTLIDPGFVTIIATDQLGPGLGQTDFDTSSSFTFFPGQNEILVWSNGVYQTFDDSGLGTNGDYIELDSTTIRFHTARPAGERVTIWKVGISATPGVFGLADLSDVDANEAGGFNAADSPTSINPFLTASGHDTDLHTDHSAVPYVAAIRSDLDDHLTAVAGFRHTAADIDIVDNFSWSNTTDIQSVMDDLESNFYQKYVAQHVAADGSHGPNVTITNTTTNQALTVTQNGAAVSAVRIFQNSSGQALRLEKSSTDVAPAMLIFNSGSSPAIEVEQRGSGFGIVVTSTSASIVPSVGIINNGSANALEITNSNVASHGVHVNQPLVSTGNAVDVYNQGSGAGAYLTNASTSSGSTAALLYVDNNHTGSSRAARIDQAGTGITLYLNKQSAGGGNVVEINNDGSGYDVRGHAGNWHITKTGEAFLRMPQAFINTESSTYTLSNTGGSWVTVVSVSVTVPAIGPTSVWLGANWFTGYGHPYNDEWRLARNGTGLTPSGQLVGGFSNTGGHYYANSLGYVDTPGPGTWTYQLQYKGASGQSAFYRSVQALLCYM